MSLVRLLLMVMLGQLVMARVRVLIRVLVVVLLLLLARVVVGEVEIGAPGAKVEIEGHGGQEKGGSPGILNARYWSIVRGDWETPPFPELPFGEV